MSFTNPNPNEPRYPYSGGTDNPGDDTSKAGGPSNVASTETAPLTLVGPSLTASVERHVALPVGLSQVGTDTVLPGGMQAIPPTGAGFDTDRILQSGDPEGGVDPLTGAPREAGQDETQGATETTSGAAPVAFPEPTP